MKKNDYFFAVLFAILFSNCDNKQPILPEPEFDASLIEGIYDGYIGYQGYDYIYGDTIPGAIYEDMSSYRKINITNIGDLNYSLSVDTSLIPLAPIIDFTVFNTPSNWAVGIRYLGNDSKYTGYRLHGGGNNSKGYFPPSNHFGINASGYNMTFIFTIKRSNPDSIYFVTFWGERIL
jgi:hypothetical protein